MRSFALLASTILLTVLGAGGCAATGTSDADGSAAMASLDDAPVEGREAHLTVYGMSCPLCAHNVDKMLLEVPGVTAVDVDMSTGSVRVALDGKTPVTRRQLTQAVDRSGFSLQGIEVR